MLLKDLEYFHALVRLGNFTKVAEQFKVSQPTITYAIKRLEKAYGTQLVHRDQAHHSLTITEAGQILESHIKIIFQQLETAHSEISRLQDKKIAIGMPPIIGNHYFPKISTKLFNLKLMDQIAITNGGSQDIYQLLKNGKLDAALIGSTQSILDQQLQTGLLAEKKFVIVISKNHPFANRKSISFKELTAEKFIMLNEHFVHLTWF